MAKLALCIKRSDAPESVIDAFASGVGTLLKIPHEFWQTPVQLVDRARCETDESLLQLLPYVTLDHENKMFRYTRGGGGAEARLHGNYSIGVGGHVDTAPQEGQTLPGVLRAEAVREVGEEVALQLFLKDVTFTDFICDPTNPVGRVHLGLWAQVELSEDEVSHIDECLEARNIENAHMSTVLELREPDVYDRLENWSKLIVDSRSSFKPDLDEDESDGIVLLSHVDGTQGPTTFEAAVQESDEDDWDDEDCHDCECNKCYECDQDVEDCECEEEADLCINCQEEYSACSCSSQPFEDNKE